jgi:hypothetical protein
MGSVRPPASDVPVDSEIVVQHQVNCVDQLNISVFTDDLTLDDPHEATDVMIRSFCKACSAVGLSGGLSAVDTAMAQATAPSYRFVAYTQDRN